MKTSNSDKRVKIFKLFSKNLGWVKDHPEISFKPDFENGFICPLCFKLFSEKDLDLSLDNHLTLEDVPPKSLGGKPTTLTCKDCNSKSGHSLDNNLLNRLLEIDADSFLPNSKTKAKFKLSDKIVNGFIEVDKKGTLNINLQSERSNPKDSAEFMDEMFPPRTIYNPIFYPEKIFEHGYKSPEFNLEFLKKANERKAEVALLRIGYLLAFSAFGNGFLINGGLYKVREQILNPEKEIIPKVFWLPIELPAEREGINIVTLPEELRCFLIVFRLKTKSQSRQFSIVLPGPTDPGIKVYDFILNKLCVGDGTTFLDGMTEDIDTTDFLKYEKFAFASQYFWQKNTASDYKPNLPPDESIE